MGESKVYDFDRLCLFFVSVQDEHDILWFQIPMYDSNIVQMFHTQD